MNLTHDPTEHRVPPARRAGSARAGIALGLAGLFVVLVGYPQRADARRPAPATPAAEASKKESLRGAFARLPLSFEANQGQTDSRVKFLARGMGYGIWLTANEAVLKLRKGKPELPSAAKRAGKTTRVGRAPKLPAYRSAVVRFKLAGSNPAPTSQGLGMLSGKANYLIGKDRTKWQRDVPTFAKARFDEVYPGIDVEYYGNQRRLEHDFVVAPGADPRKIRMQITGASKLALDRRGNLVVQTGAGTVVQKAPYIYQDLNGARKQIAGGYKLNKNEVTFQVARYDATRPLVIDPTLAWGTYQGGSGIDTGASIALGSTGNAYITGYTESADFPTTAGAVDVTFNDPSPIGAVNRRRGGTFYRPQQAPGADAYVTQINAAGTARVYSTYLGGSGNDFGNAIDVDAAGAAYVTGTSDSPDFPFLIPGGAAAGVRRAGARPQGVPELFFDGFTTKINPSGADLAFSGFVGGSDFDEGRGIAVDAATGDVHVSGVTFSDDFFTTDGAFDNTYNGGGDAFLAVVFGDGTDLAYATFIGGTDFDEGTDVDVNGVQTAHVVGTTFSTDFPVNAGDFGPTYGGNGDAFAVNIIPADDNPTTGADPNDPSDLFYAGFLGGAEFDEGLGVAVNVVDDSPYIVGQTFSSGFPTTAGAADTTYGGEGDSFLTLLNPAGTGIGYSTFLGGTGFDGASLERGGGNGKSIGVAVSATGTAWIAGTTFSTDFPTAGDADDVFDATANGGGDAFLLHLDPAVAGAAAIVYSTYLGGTAYDQGNDVALFGLVGAAASGVCVTGTTLSADFPTTGGIDTTLGGTQDAFVACFTEGDGPPPGDCFGDIRVSARRVGFGQVRLGNTRRRSFRIRNVSEDEDLEIIDIVGPSDPFFISATTPPDVPFTLGPGERRTIIVEFAPEVRGRQSDEILIISSDCDAGEGITVVLQGTGQRRRRGRGGKGGGGGGGGKK